MSKGPKTQAETRIKIMTQESVPERRPSKRLTKVREAEILARFARSMVNGGYITEAGFGYRLRDVVFVVEKVGEDCISVDEYQKRAMRAESIAEAIERRIFPKGK